MSSSSLNFSKTKTNYKSWLLPREKKNIDIKRDSKDWSEGQDTRWKLPTAERGEETYRSERWSRRRSRRIGSKRGMIEGRTEKSGMVEDSRRAKRQRRNEEGSVYRETGTGVWPTGVGRGGSGRHGDKQPPGPTELVAGVGRKGWPRASAGQVRPVGIARMSLDTRGTQGCPGRERRMKDRGKGVRERLESGGEGGRQAKMADDATPTMSITPFFDAKPSQPPSTPALPPTPRLPPSLQPPFLPRPFTSQLLDYISQRWCALSPRFSPASCLRSR